MGPGWRAGAPLLGGAGSWDHWQRHSFQFGVQELACSSCILPALFIVAAPGAALGGVPRCPDGGAPRWSEGAGPAERGAPRPRLPPCLLLLAFGEQNPRQRPWPVAPARQAPGAADGRGGGHTGLPDPPRCPPRSPSQADSVKAVLHLLLQPPGDKSQARGRQRGSQIIFIILKRVHLWLAVLQGFS